MTPAWLRLVCELLREHADAEPWTPGIPPDSYRHALPDATLGFCLNRATGEYVLVVERKDRPPSDDEVHQVRIELGGPILLSRWQRFERDDQHGVRLTWRKVDAEPVPYAQASAWLERQRERERKIVAVIEPADPVVGILDTAAGPVHLRRSELAGAIAEWEQAQTRKRARKKT